jgi:hypothetical protein
MPTAKTQITADDYAPKPPVHPMPETIPGGEGAFQQSLPTSLPSEVDGPSSPSDREAQAGRRAALANALRIHLDRAAGPLSSDDLAADFAVTPDEVDAALRSLDTREGINQDEHTGAWRRGS